MLRVNYATVSRSIDCPLPRAYRPEKFALFTDSKRFISNFPANKTAARNTSDKRPRTYIVCADYSVLLLSVRVTLRRTIIIERRETLTDCSFYFENASNIRGLVPVPFNSLRLTYYLCALRGKRKLYGNAFVKRSVPTYSDNFEINRVYIFPYGLRYISKVYYGCKLL